MAERFRGQPHAGLARVRAHRVRLLLALAAAVAIMPLAVHAAGHGARAAGPGGADPTPQPALGTADRSTVLMGAATAGAPGEAWAYRVLPLDVPAPSVGSGNAAFAIPPAGGAAPPGQLVFERAADADPAWTIQETPVDEEGKPYRGMEPNRFSARITPHAGGLLVGQDSTRPTGKQTVVLARDPGGRFRVLPEPPAGVLLGAGEGGEAGESEPKAEALAEREGAGTVADAAVENGSHTEAYFGALGRGRELGVARWDGEHWTREPIELPAGYSGGFQIVAIAGSSPQNLWLLGEPSQSSGLGIVLFKRTEAKAGEYRWEAASLGSALFAAAETPADGVTKLGPLTGAAQPLTVTAKGVWIDGNLQAPGGGSDGYDFTLYYDVSEGKLTGSWCDASRGGGEALCEHPFGARFGRQAGYRSFAFDGPGYGTRIVTNPLLPGGDDTTNLGSYLSFEGTTFTRMPGAGADNSPGGAFYSARDGWLEGPVQVTQIPAARAPGELAGLRARSVHRGRDCARLRAWRPGRAGARRRRRGGRGALHPRARLGTGVPADGQRRGQLADPARRRLAGRQQGVRRGRSRRDVGVARGNRAVGEGSRRAPERLSGQPARDRLRPDRPGDRLRRRPRRHAAALRQELDAGAAPERLLRSELHVGRVRRLGGDGGRRTRPARQRRLGLEGRPRSARAAVEPAHRAHPERRSGAAERGSGGGRTRRRHRARQRRGAMALLRAADRQRDGHRRRADPRRLKGARAAVGRARVRLPAAR